MEIKEKFEQLGKDSVAYGIGGTLTRSIGLITLPIFTRVFSPGEYGIIEMLAVANGFMGAVIALDIPMAQSVHFFEQKKRHTEVKR